MKGVALCRIAVILLVVVAVGGCEPPGSSQVQDPLGMEVPLDPSTLSPSPFYEPKTEQEIAQARRDREQAEAAQIETVGWVDRYCQVTEVTVNASRFTLLIPAGEKVCRIDVQTSLRYDVDIVANGEVIGAVTGPITDQYQPAMTGYLSREGITGAAHLEPIVGPMSAPSGLIRTVRVWIKK